MVYQELLGFIADPDYGDIADPINGRDIVVEKQTPQEAGNQFGKITIRVKPNQTPLTENNDVLEQLLNGQSELTKLYNEPSYDELKEALSNYLNPTDDETSETSDQTVKSSTTNSATNVEDAFDKLFNDN